MGGAIIGSEAVAAGLITRGQLRWNYQTVYRDVYVPRDAALTMSTRAYAAWLWSRRRGVITGRAAAALHGARWVDDAADVEMLWQNSHRPSGIITRRDRITDDEICLVRGIPVATPARTALDLGRFLSRDAAVTHLDALARVTGVKESDVRPLIDRYAGARGVKKCRTALSLMDDGAQSPKETWLRLMLVDAGFPPPQTQIPLYDDGYVVAYLDMGWPEIKVAVEYDGDQHRTDRAQYIKDIRRSEFVDGLGWLNIRVVAEDRRDRVIGRVANAWARREREGMVVNMPKLQPGMLFRGRC
jgi:hypothetical protein